MGVRPIVRYPDHSLKLPSQPFSGSREDAESLIQDLLDTMEASPATVGLAAPQIGVLKRAFVIDVTGHKKAHSCHGELVLFDPEVIAASAPVVAREGCLSVPDLTGDVSRAGLVVVQGLTPEGEPLVLEADAFEARAVLHELDHLNGRLFLDRVTSADRVFRRKVYR